MTRDIPTEFHELVAKAQFQMQFLVLMVFRPINQTVKAARTLEDNRKIPPYSHKGSLKSTSEHVK